MLQLAYFLVLVVAWLGWLGRLLRPFALLLALLWVITVAGLIVTGMMLRVGAGGVDALWTFLFLSSLLAFGVVPLTLFLGFSWLVHRLRARSGLCAACGQATNQEEARFCESCAVLGGRAAPRHLFGGKLVNLAVASDPSRTASLVIRRKPGILNYFGDWQVILDERHVGSIGRGEERRFEVAPGPHDVRLRIGYVTTNTIEFTGDEREVILECGRDNAEAFWLGVEPLVHRLDRSYRLTRVTRHAREQSGCPV